jgi:hypothetical protein
MSTKLPGAKLRQVVIDHISSDFKLHILFDPKPKGEGPAYEYRPHKKWLILHNAENWAVQEAMTLALAIQLGAIYTGKGPVRGLGDLINRVPSALDMFRTWESNLLRCLYSRGPRTTLA